MTVIRHCLLSNSETVRRLAWAMLCGEDCWDVLHDALIESGEIR